MGCPFWENGVKGKGHGVGVKDVLFIGDVLNGCFSKDAVLPPSVNSFRTVLVDRNSVSTLCSK